MMKLNHMPIRHSTPGSPGRGWTRGLAALVCAFAPTLAAADAACSAPYDYGAMLQQALKRLEAYGWLAGLDGSCWKTGDAPQVEQCFEFHTSDGALRVQQTRGGEAPSHLYLRPSGVAGRLSVTHYAANHSVVARAELQLQPSGEMVLTNAVNVSGQAQTPGLGVRWIWRRIDHERFEIALQTVAEAADATARSRPAGTTARWVFKRTWQRYGACANGAR